MISRRTKDALAAKEVQGWCWADFELTTQKPVKTRSSVPSNCARYLMNLPACRPARLLRR
jgi:hypothetical protein